MVKFVWLAVPLGGQIPVNPDQVAYLRQTKDGQTAVVFGAMQGGLHEQLVEGDGLSVAAALEAAGAVLSAAPPTAPSPRRRSRARTADT